jgi:hypothetical protein
VQIIETTAQPERALCVRIEDKKDQLILHILIDRDAYKVRIDFDFRRGGLIQTAANRQRIINTKPVACFVERRKASHGGSYYALTAEALQEWMGRIRAFKAA